MLRATRTTAPGGFARVVLSRADGTVISPWHDIPMNGPRGGLHFVNEIGPGALQPKMEIDSKGDARAIVQDKNKDGTPRFYRHPVASRWNYGAIPQTYEDPRHNWPGTALKGDGDPLDAVELSGSALDVGAVVEVRVLGALGLLDGGEVDWKLVTTNVEEKGNPYGHYRCVEEMWHNDPQILIDIRNWFRDYKLAEKKPVNDFLFGGTFLNARYALQGVVAEARRQWEALPAAANRQ